MTWISIDTYFHFVSQCKVSKGKGHITTRYRDGQKVLVHILQDHFYFKDFQGRDVKHSASKQAKLPENIATRTNSKYEELLKGNMNAKNGNESHLRLSPE